MSGWNGQFNAMLQRLENKAKEGGGGEISDSILFIKPTGTVYHIVDNHSYVFMAAADKSVSEINAAFGVKPVFVCFPDITKFTDSNAPTISFESSYTHIVPDFDGSYASLSIGKPTFDFLFMYAPPGSPLQNVYVIAMVADK